MLACGDPAARNRGTAIRMPLPDFIMRSPAPPDHAYATPASPVVRTPRPRTDIAHKVVGVGNQAFIVMLQGRDANDPLFLQVKQATASVLEGHLPKSRFLQHGQRVVQGQRMMQAASDI